MPDLSLPELVSQPDVISYIDKVIRFRYSRNPGHDFVLDTRQDFIIFLLLDKKESSRFNLDRPAEWKSYIKKGAEWYLSNQHRDRNYGKTASDFSEDVFTDIFEKQSLGHGGGCKKGNGSDPCNSYDEEFSDENYRQENPLDLAFMMLIRESVPIKNNFTEFESAVIRNDQPDKSPGTKPKEPTKRSRGIEARRNEKHAKWKQVWEILREENPRYYYQETDDIHDVSSYDRLANHRLNYTGISRRVGLSKETVKTVIEKLHQEFQAFNNRVKNEWTKYDDRLKRNWIAKTIKDVKPPDVTAPDIDRASDEDIAEFVKRVCVQLQLK